MPFALFNFRSIFCPIVRCDTMDREPPFDALLVLIVTLSPPCALELVLMLVLMLSEEALLYE
jgi:hypothetical protein